MEYLGNGQQIYFWSTSFITNITNNKYYIVNMKQYCLKLKAA